MKPPAFQLYPDDLIGGTAHFSDAELGLYMRLLCANWSRGALPDDDKELLSYSKGRTSLARVKEKFVKGDDGKLRNPRLELERQKQLEWREKCRIGGVKSGEARRVVEQPLNNPFKTVPTNGEVKANSPLSTLQSPSTEVQKPSASSSVTDVFEEWNRFADNVKLPKCLVLSDKRRRFLSARLRDSFFVGNWRNALLKIKVSDFCKGKNKTGWSASFDWFIQPDTVAKIMEGKYTNARPTDLPGF